MKVALALQRPSSGSAPRTERHHPPTHGGRSDITSHRVFAWAQPGGS
jgi:hypothetical protein